MGPDVLKLIEGDPDLLQEVGEFGIDDKDPEDTL